MLLDFKRLISLSLIVLFAIQLSASNTSLISQSADTLAAYGYYQRADSLYAISQFEPALENFTQAISGYEQAKAYERLAMCYFFVCKIYMEKVQLDKSEAYAEKILKECVPNIEYPGIHKARVYLLLCRLANQKRKLEDAESYAQKCISELKPLGKERLPILYDIYQLQAKNYYMLREIDKSLDVIQKGLKIGEEHYGNMDIRIAQSNNSLGNIYFAKLDYLRAKIHFEKAIKIVKEIHGEDHRTLITSYANMGSVEMNLGNDEKSNYYHENALRLIIKYYGPQHPYIGHTYFNIASTYRHRTEYEKALEYLNLSLEVIKNAPKVNYDDLTLVYTDMARNHLYLGNQDVGFQYVKMALDLISSEKKLTDGTIAHTLLTLSDAHQVTKDYDKVLSYAEAADSLLKKKYNSSSSILAGASNRIGMAYAWKGKYLQALQRFDSALQYATTYHDDSKNSYSIMEPILYIGSLGQKIKSLNSYYLVSKDDDFLTRSINTTKIVDSLASVFRNTHGFETDKITYSNKLKETYEAAIKAHWLKYGNTKDQSHKIDMFRFSEKTKSQTLKQVNKFADQVRLSDAPDSLIFKEKLIKADIRRLSSELDQVKIGERSMDTLAIDQQETEILKLSESYEKLLSSLKNEYPNYYNLILNYEVSSLDQIRQALEEETTLVEYFVGDSLLYTFVVDQDSLHVFEQPNPNIQETVNTLHKSVSEENYEEYIVSGHELYQKLIAPIEDKIKNDRLVIVPDGALWHVNFDLLLTTNRKVSYKELDYLINKYTISYVYSADMMVLEREREVTKSGNNELLAFSFESSENQDQGESISLRALRESNDDLPGSRKEIKAISTLVDGEYFYGSKADKASFVENAKDYSVLHLAVHGIMNEKYPMNSKLQFTPTDSTDDGALHAYELYNMSLNTDLAVLSACNTGAGKIAKGEGIMSLGRAFTYAGCKSLVLTQWEVPDATTPEVMASFYEDLSNGKPKDIALRQAKLKYLANASEPLSSPLHWGSFVLIGNQDAIALGDKTNFIIFAISGFVIIILAGVFRRKKKVETT